MSRAMINIEAPSAADSLDAYTNAVTSIFASAAHNRIEQKVVLEAMRGLTRVVEPSDQAVTIRDCTLTSCPSPEEHHDEYEP